MGNDQIQGHRWNAPEPFILPFPNDWDMERPRSLTPPPQEHDLASCNGSTVHWMNDLLLRTVDYLRNNLSPSPAASDTSPPVGGDTWSGIQSNPDSRSQSPVSSAISFDEEYLRIMLRWFLAKCISHSSLSVPPETYSESPSCSLSSEKSEVDPMFEHNVTSAVSERSPSPSPMDIPETSCEMELDAINSFEHQRLAIDDAILPNRAERTHVGVVSSHNPDVAPHGSLETSPDHHTKEEYPATKTICKDSCSSDVDDDSFLPECDVQSPSEIPEMYAPMEIEPRNFAPNSTTIAILPESIRTRIMTFCIEPKDLLPLIRSSPVFLQPFCHNRFGIVSLMIEHMRFRFGGDMPSSCLMVARLRNMESRGVASNPEVRKAAARRVITEIFGLSPKGPLLHPVYSLRQLKFISDILDSAESVMSGYLSLSRAHINRVSELGPLPEELALSMTETKRFMDSICLYDAYCTAFFSENAILSSSDTALRRIFLDQDGIPCGITKRFYCIMHYLRLSYSDWLYMALGQRYPDAPAMFESNSQFHTLDKHIDPLIDYFICGGTGVFRMLQDMTAPDRYGFLFRQLDRCEKDEEYRKKISLTQAGEERMWAYSEIAGGLTTEEFQTAQHFWDPTTPLGSLCWNKLTATNLNCK
ncbi:hypothetical protein FPANT_10982 [Fusarium pseudoanthophilum]|uniref:Uncharacterized protein n=1 Tax=Fusarium pseudoanthophilum TaxID=48495 RepID=A0A8H5KNG5_9HYPO|nr:hypothetical protein FPANT_10982 [Fusarium pseudoanthophilum]